MTKFFYVLAMAVIISGCTQSEKFQITVNTHENKDKTAYLIKVVENQPTILDSSKYNNGYVFEGSTAQNELVYFQLGNNKEKVAFFIENNNFSITLNEDDKEINKTEGSVLNKQYLTFLDSSNYFEERNETLYSGFQKAKIKNNTKTLDSIRSEADKLYEMEQAFSKRFANQNLDNVLGLYIVRSKIVYTMDYNDLNDVITNVPASNQHNPYFEYLSMHLAKLSKTRVGEIAPNFTMKDTAGNDISLNDFRGNYIMIDFWASWCGPCRRANPFVVEIYKDFSEKGFQILGVSFDKSREAWIKAIHDDNLTWPHVSDLQGWKNAAGQLYGINSIPHTTLIDPNGKIVANKFEHEELRKLLEEAYK